MEFNWWRRERHSLHGCYKCQPNNVNHQIDKFLLFYFYILYFRLMNIETLQWDTHLCNFFGVSKKLLPEIRSSSEVYGVFAKGVLEVGCIKRLVLQIRY